jgi:hypothetical protein
VLRTLTKYRDVGREYLYPVANSHCGYPAGKCIHPGFASISQHQHQVGAVHGNNETRHTSTSSDIHNRTRDAYKRINKLPRMCNDVRDWQCTKGAKTLRGPKDFFKTAGFWHVMNVVPNMQKARHTAGPSQ